MEIANLVLEFFKVLVWPAVTVFLLLKFKGPVDDILRQFSDRMGSAKSVKFGIFGQEVELSGTAKELIRERERLLQDQDASAASIQKAERIGRSVDRLSNPMSDMVGVALLSREQGGARIEEILKDIWLTMSTRPDGTPPPIAPMALIALSREVERILAELESLGLVSVRSESYRLTAEGRRLFSRVKENQAQLVERFHKLFAQ